MHEYLPFIVIGLTTGAVYALASLGLVLTYRTSGVFNFAHGAIAMFATYCFYSLRQHVPTWMAAVAVLVVVAPMMGVAIAGLFRRLEAAGATAAIVSSLGLLVALQGLAIVIWGAQTRRMEPFLPTSTYRILDVNVGYDQTFVVAIVLAVSLALVVFFQRTHLGLQTRAVVDNKGLAALVGTTPSAVTRFSWVLGCSFAAASGILFSPFVGLDSVLLTLLVVQAFGAAAIGRLRSFTRTAVAAFALGVAQSIATKIVGQIGSTSLQGLPSAIPFVMLFAILLFSRRGTLREPSVGRLARQSSARFRRFRFKPVPLVIVFGFAAALPPFISGSRLLTLSTTVAFVLIFASLSLLVGLSRQLSLAHAIFVVLGATTLAQLQQVGLPYLIALPLSALAMAPVGAALAFPAIRLSTLYLGLATFAFGVLAQNLLFPAEFVFGVDGLTTIRRPGFLSDDAHLFYFTLVIVFIAVVAVELVRVTRLGRLLVALGDSPTAAESLGISALAARVVVFSLSAFLAALAGGLLGTLVRSVSETSFTFASSLLWVTVLVATGASSFGGLVLAAIVLVAVPAVFTSGAVTEWQPVIFGLATILLAQTENGLVGSFQSIDPHRFLKQGAWRVGSRRGIERLVRATRPERDSWVSACPTGVGR